MDNTTNPIFEHEALRYEIDTYLRFADIIYESKGRKEHGISHAEFSADIAGKVLAELGYSAREQRLAKAAAYMHDIGSVINRQFHARSGAIIVFNLFESLRPIGAHEDILEIITAIGSHEDKHAVPANAIAAAVVLGDKSDVRLERLRGSESAVLRDKHSKVIAACEGVEIKVSKETKTVSLHIEINTKVCSVMDYFEIFLSRTLFCQKACLTLNCSFELYINKDKFL
jgi:HD superfamily phosphodiesterase